MYRVTREILFCYGHRLLNYEGKCRHLHGHNGRAVVTLEAPTLDDKGMLVDFGEIKHHVQRWIDETLDHTMLLCKTDPILPLLVEQGPRKHDGVLGRAEVHHATEVRDVVARLLRSLHCKPDMHLPPG